MSPWRCHSPHSVPLRSSHSCGMGCPLMDRSRSARSCRRAVPSCGHISHSHTLESTQELTTNTETLREPTVWRLQLISKLLVNYSFKKTLHTYNWVKAIQVAIISILFTTSPSFKIEDYYLFKPCFIKVEKAQKGCIYSGLEYCTEVRLHFMWCVCVHGEKAVAFTIEDTPAKLKDNEWSCCVSQAELTWSKPGSGTSSLVLASVQKEVHMTDRDGDTEIWCRRNIPH